jgi:succinoglycan biosynthesis protein ExoM
MKRSDQKDSLKNQIQSKSSILCSVCIATYRRPQLLEKLLRSLANQLLPEMVNLEIVVVDNDVDQAGESIVRRFKNTSRIRFYYFSQPVKNISITRNMGVENASGEYILFIDDDEVASAQWVSHLLNTLSAYNADGVFGQVLPKFHPQAPKWMQQADFFFNHLPGTGEKATQKYTTNCIIKASLLKGLKEPFDPRYGLTGGEDNDLFARLESKGARFVYSTEALTWEYLAPDRTRLSYLFLRRIRYGAGPAHKSIEGAGKKKFLVRFLIGLKAISLGIISFIFMIFFLGNKVRRMQWFLRIAINIGRFLAVFGKFYRYQWYR